MTRLFNRYATPLITGLFLVSLVSGVGLFFHIGPSGFHGMHEWLSMVLIIPFVLHIWKNWRPMSAYFKHAPMAIALVVSLIAGGLFLLPSGDGGEGRSGPPQFALAEQVMQAPLSAVAPALGTTAEALSARLSEAGFQVSEGQSLAGIAAASGRKSGEVMALITSSH